MAKKSTRAAQGSGTIRRRKDGRWEARLTVGTDPGTGKQIQRSFYGSTQKEALEQMQEAAVEVNLGIYKAPCKLTVGQWLDIWQADYLGAVKPLTVRTYQEQIKKHIAPALGCIKLEALTTHAIQHLYNVLGNGAAANLSPKSIRNVHGVFHKALQQAVANGYIRNNPADACILPKVERAEIKPLEPPQVAAFLDALDGEEYANLFTVALFTGMRQGELLGLAWDAVDFDKGVITVRQQLQKLKSGYIFTTPKSGKARTIVPAPLVLDALKRERVRQTENRLKSCGLWDNPHDLVFTDAIGKNLVRRTVVKHFKQIAARIGVPDARFHDLRHSFAVNSLQAGDDIKTVQENLGHATAAFTLDVYAHASEQMRQDSAQRMQQFYEQIKRA